MLKEEEDVDIPEWIKPGFWGFAIGAVVVLVVGFKADVLVTNSSAVEMAASQSREAVVNALTPFCIKAAHTDPDFQKKYASIIKGSTWNHYEGIMKSGWATLPGSLEANEDVAGACASKLAEIQAQKTAKK